MQQFRIQGEAALSGEIRVAGAKNHAIKMIPAAAVCDGPVELTNVPEIADIDVMLEMFEALGGSYEREGDRILLHPENIDCNAIPQELSSKVRVAILFVGPLLAKCGEVTFGQPGGDQIGKRPTDLFQEGFEALGAVSEETPDGVKYTLGQRPERVRYVLPWVSHTVTEAMILAAVRGTVETRIANAAMEPEVVALCDFLRSCGAQIEGDGTPNITIRGVEKLSGGTCRIISDRIELATFACMGALSGKDLAITGGEPRYLETFWRVLERMGVLFEIEDTTVRVNRATPVATEIRTHEYPGLATDFQPPLTVLATQAEGLSMVHETIYEGRLFYTDLLNKMGARIIQCDPHRVLVNGPVELYGRTLDTPDIRAGIALVLAALRAQGESVIENVHHIDRGYEKIEARLTAIGAEIVREECVA
ncbi:MAG: UDP-N-acetylglucosamine 1-carboxyvinyltransferase [Candidatus Doudnabacteria bacterium]|nr:UDP-N-acetylglucosamine 1-carboxyvinyltransferase [Candidatus Doudnabacteria bacterium]MCA9387791.1 UDP-N-acetylglucosamine 1-carboxyvinyltransferase [Candidatus Andersenbacteria bacterium]